MQLWRILYLRSALVLTIQSLWEQDLGKEITQYFWEDILFQVRSSSISAGHALVQCKVLHRTHWWKLTLSKIYPDADPVCDRCKQAHDSLMLWSCSYLTRCTSAALRSKCVGLCCNTWWDCFASVEGRFRGLFNSFGQMSDFAPVEVTLLSLRPGLQVFFFSNVETVKHTLCGSTAIFPNSWKPFFNNVETVQFCDTPLWIWLSLFYCTSFYATLLLLFYFFVHSWLLLVMRYSIIILFFYRR